MQADAAKMSRRHLLGAAAGLAGTAIAGRAWAADMRMGINAGVSFAETEEQQRRRYGPLLDALSRGLSQRLEFASVYSDRVGKALESAAFDFLLVHTHAALRAERDAGWQVIAFSDDRKDNAVHFFVRPDSALRSVEQLLGGEIGAPGLQSWATATARATLRGLAPGRDPAFRVTRLQEVVPYMVELRTVAAGVCRSRAVVDESVAAGRIRVIHVTPPRPLYALIAAPALPEATCERMRAAVAALGADKVYEGTPVKGLHPADDQAERLRRFFLA